MQKNILHISTSDTGGAGLAALRLHKTMLENGLQSQFLCLDKTSSIKNVIRHSKFYPRFYHRFLSSLGWPITKTERNFKKSEEIYKSYDIDIFSFPSSDYRVENHQAFLKADIVICHWTAGFLDFKSFFENFPKSKKLFWYCHDMYAINGGFHTNFEAKKFSDTALSTLDQELQQEKIEQYNKCPSLNFIANSQWTFDQLSSKSFIDIKSLFKIELGIPKNELGRIDTMIAKRALGYADSDFLILNASMNVNSQLKGFERVKEIISHKDLKDRSRLIVLGECMDYNEGISNIDYLGIVSNLKFKSILFSAADVVISGSYEESFGQTIIEGYACGTPSIVFNNAALPELVKNDITGYVINSITEGQTILQNLIENKSKLNDLSNAAYSSFIDNYTSEKQMEKLLNTINLL